MLNTDNYQKHLHLSWESILRVLPNNATQFLLFDLKLKHTYELTIVAENELGLGTFSPILTIQLNDTDESPLGHLHYSNETHTLNPFWFTIYPYVFSSLMSGCHWMVM